MHLDKACALQQLDAQLAASRQQTAGLEAVASQMQADLTRLQSQASQASEANRLAGEQHVAAIRGLQTELTEVSGARDIANSEKQVRCDFSLLMFALITEYLLASSASFC